MKQLLYAAACGLGAMAAVASLNACKTTATTADADSTAHYVTVADGEFRIGDSVYRYVGTNFWYGAILASEGRGGDRERLARELDLLRATATTRREP